MVRAAGTQVDTHAVRRNPKVSLCILDEQWPLTYLQVKSEDIDTLTHSTSSSQPW